MARKYIFICDGCGASQQRDSECLPDGWGVISAAQGAADVCSLACASVAARRIGIPQLPSPVTPQLGAHQP